MKKILVLIFLIGIFFVTSPAFAITYVEDFEAPFPAWESAWLGANTNLQNYYVVAGNPDHSYRGNNPDGLWIDDGDGIYSGDTVEIIFNNAFGSNLTSLALDIAGYTHAPAHLRIYDMSINLLLDEQVTLTNGATTDPGVYAHYSVTSANGISKFVLTQDGGGQIEGNTGIDNVVVDSGSTPVPEPATMLLLGSGLLGLWGARKKFKK